MGRQKFITSGYELRLATRTILEPVYKLFIWRPVLAARPALPIGTWAIQHVGNMNAGEGVAA